MPKILADNDVEQIPPPLPPPRGESLAAAITNHHMNGKPLPMIPCSASAHELDTTSSSPPPPSSTANHIDRPLPPLPRGDSLEKVDESANTDDSDDDDDDVDDDDDDDEENELIDSDAGNNGGDCNELSTRLENNDDGGGGFDADATLPPSPTEKTNGIFSSNDIGYDICTILFLDRFYMKLIFFFCLDRMEHDNVQWLVRFAKQKWRTKSGRSNGNSGPSKKKWLVHQKNAGLS